MRNRFVKVSNVLRFQAAVAEVERRGAVEKQIVVVHGDAGLGKSKTGVQWAVHHDAATISVKPSAGTAWVMSDLVRELGIVPGRICQQLYGQATEALRREPRPIVVDEVENALDRGAAALDLLRAVADECAVTLVLIGREQTVEKLRRHRQIWTRVVAPVEFLPLSIDDVALLAAELVEGDLDDDLLEEIHRASAGLLRDALRLLAYADAVAKRGSGRLSLAAAGELPALYPSAGRHRGRRTASTATILPGPGHRPEAG